MLQKYISQVRDTEDVKCSYLEGEEVNKPVSNLLGISKDVQDISEFRNN